MTFHARQDETSEWLNYLQPEGLVVGANVLRERQLTPIRQTPLDTEEAREALKLPKDANREDDKNFVLQSPWHFFESVLGWPARLVAGSPGGPPVAAELSRTAPEHETLLAPDMALLWNGPPAEDMLVQALVALHPTLDPDARNQFGGSEWEASPHQRLERLIRETNIGLGILVARNTLRLIFAPRGETAGWISWPLAALGRVEGRPILAGLKLCLGRNAFFTGAPEARLLPLLKASREAQNEVSEKLSGQVLGALYELLRGLHRAAPDRIETLAEAKPHHLYEGLLTCLLRLVFLLYAEDRDLLPTSRDPQRKALWESGYSIKTLYARLLADEAINPDTMDERRGGWGQLLAVFRLVHASKHNDWVTPRGGKLFDPDFFPFLEGRAKGSKAEEAQVLPVSDGTILRILHGLMTVDSRSFSGEKIRERLSYRSLDVESIGSVYETVMGFTARRAIQRMIALRDEKKLPAFVGLQSLLNEKPNDRQKWLKEEGIKPSAKQTKAIKEATDEASLLEAFGGLIDERASPKSAPLGAGSPYLQPTAERRRSGSHYTPRSLTEPIVRHALEPAFECLGANASPEEVLTLKVLDPACGSGAFLVEACRQLGKRLEQAWDIHKAEKPSIPSDEDETIHACRLVAQRCLYGVDRNPMAVDLARLSLWLVTLAREHEFSFLDHALKSGDSLVGLTQAEISAANWDASKPGLPLFREMIRDSIGKSLRGREAIRHAADDVLLEAQAARYSRVEDASEPARIAGDAVIAAFFSADKVKARETTRAEVESWITGSMPPKWDTLKAKANAFRTEHGWRPFHWQIEFPEVFAREHPGFDAVVGNPPFMSGVRISEHLGLPYNNFLVNAFEGSTRKVDICAFFFRKAYSLLRKGGAFGLLATNTISQGTTRRAGLDWIAANAGCIYVAETSRPWPGEAAVVVSVVWMAKELSVSPCLLDDQRCPAITPLLKASIASNEARPTKLTNNKARCYQGSSILGTGFFLDEPLALTMRLANTRNKEVVRPCVGGRELNEMIGDRPPRWIIDMGERDMSAAQSYLEPFAHLEAHVRDARTKKDPIRYPRLVNTWWKFWHSRAVLYQAIARNRATRVLARARVCNHHMLAFLPNDWVYTEQVVVFVFDTNSTFAMLQSRVHEVWARKYASTMKNDVRYVAPDCFETFPFPRNSENSAGLEVAGRAYHDHRAALMAAGNEGLTRTYNRFHDAYERSEGIARLRDLHAELDRAVLRAYDWNDLADTVQPQFLTEETEDDHTYWDRYFWSAEQRESVLSRLLALNTDRRAAEVAAGIAPPDGGEEENEQDQDEDQPSLALD